MTDEPTTGPVSVELLPVEQCDRDGAADYWEGLVNQPELQAMRDGKRDDHWKIQKLARHRLQSQPRADGPAVASVREADYIIDAVNGICQEKIDHWLARSRGPISTPDTAMAAKIYVALVDLKGRAIVGIRRALAQPERQPAPVLVDAVEAMRAACIAAVRAEQKYEASDFPVCNSIVHAIEGLSQPQSPAPEPVAHNWTVQTTFSPDAIDAASRETDRLTRELDITNADHIALWLEANLIGNFGSPVWLACRIIEAHEQEMARAALSAVPDRGEVARLREIVERAQQNIPEHYANWHNEARAALSESGS